MSCLPLHTHLERLKGMPSCPPLPTPTPVQALACALPVDLSSPLPTPAPVPVQALAGAPLVDLYTYSAPFLPDSGLTAASRLRQACRAGRNPTPLLAQARRAPLIVTSTCETRPAGGVCSASAEM